MNQKFQQAGTDSNGKKYETLEDLWKDNKKTWYQSASISKINKKKKN